jgi:hypothetical protein
MFKIGIEGIAKSVGVIKRLTIEERCLLFFLAYFEAGVLCSLMTIVDAFSLLRVIKGTKREAI